MIAQTEKQLLESYIKAKERYEYLSAELKEAQRDKDIKEQMIVGMLTSKGADATTRFDGLGYAKLRKPVVNVANYPKEKEGEIFTFVRNQGYGDIIKEDIHSTTFRSFIKTCLDEGVDFPKCVFYETKQNITIYGNKKNKINV